MSEFFDPFMCGWIAAILVTLFDRSPWWVRVPAFGVFFLGGHAISDRISIVIAR